MLDKSAFLSFNVDALFKTVKRKEVEALPDVPLVKIEEPPSAGIGVKITAIAAPGNKKLIWRTR
jgi:hypothetical protein